MRADNGKGRALAAMVWAAALALAGGAAGPAVAVAADQPLNATSLTRIVAIGGDVTEILYELGLGANIVAVDTTSQYPPEALRDKASVGYMRALSAEGVLSTGGTVIVASAGAGPPEAVRALKSASIPYVEIADDPSAAGLVEKVLAVARVVGRESEGERVARRIRDGLARLETARARLSEHRKVLFALAVQGGRMVVGGRGSSADAMLHLAGAENAADSLSGYKPISDEGLVQMAPDVILVMRRDGSSLDQLAAVKAVAATPAGARGQLREVDALSLLGFGPRTPAALYDLMLDLYPELRTSPAPAKP
jgi:iron complex transport system substrate-binding protein